MCLKAILRSVTRAFRTPSHHRKKGGSREANELIYHTPFVWLGDIDENDFVVDCDERTGHLKDETQVKNVLEDHLTSPTQRKMTQIVVPCSTRSFRVRETDMCSSRVFTCLYDMPTLPTITISPPSYDTFFSLASPNDGHHPASSIQHEIPIDYFSIDILLGFTNRVYRLSQNAPCERAVAVNNILLGWLHSIRILLRQLENKEAKEPATGLWLSPESCYFLKSDSPAETRTVCSTPDTDYNYLALDERSSNRVLADIGCAEEYIKSDIRMLGGDIVLWHDIANLEEQSMSELQDAMIRMVAALSYVYESW